MNLENFLNQLLINFTKLILIVKRLQLVFLTIFFALLSVLSYNKNYSKDLKLSALDFIPNFSIYINKVDSYLDEVKSLKNIRKENLSLKEENEKLKSYYENISQLIFENIELKNLLNFIHESKLKYITARILSNISGPYKRTSIIMAGTKENVKKGQVVLSHNGIVGRILNVEEKFSRILYINDINSKIPIISSVSRIKAIASGNNSNLLDLQYVPENSNIKSGELVITSGDSEFFPPNITVGHIVIDNNKLKIKPSVDINKLNFISIIIN